MFVNVCETLEFKIVLAPVVVFVSTNVCEVVVVLIIMFVYVGTRVLTSTKVFALDNVLELYKALIPLM